MDSLVNSRGVKGKQRRRSSQYQSLVNEINVTPLVDIMLVLLIVFMISTPLLINGVPVDLPEASARALAVEKEPLIVSITGDGRISVKEKYYLRNEFIEYLRSAGSANPDKFMKRIIIKSSKEANYGQVLGILAMIQEAGFRNIALASIPIQGR